MSNVVSMDGRAVGFINGEAIPKPRSGQEYLAICKRFLTEEDYRQVLCCIMDVDIQEKAIMDGDPLVAIVDSYFSFSN
jgi:hypothetical protein